MNLEARIAEAMANGDVTELREIAHELNSARIECMRRYTFSKSARVRVRASEESKRLVQLGEPVFAAIKPAGPR